MDMELVTHVVTIALSFGVGLPILINALRAGDRLAALLAGSLVIDGVEWVFWAIYLYWPGLSPALDDAAATASRLGISAAILCLGCFTWLTFRPQSRAATLFFWLSAGAIAIGFVGSGTVGDWRGFRSDHVWIWIENLAQIGIYGWAGAEALLYYGNARKRVALGLADPVVANKFALWGIYSASAGIVQLLFIVSLASPSGYTGLGSIDIFMTLIGVTALWIAFFPPRRYQAWLRGAAPGEGSGLL
jgi:hypothetical protein